jgi:hypothetical protein
MRCFHRTFASKQILQDGFKDATDTYMSGNSYSGVWFSADYPLDINEGAKGDKVLMLEIPNHIFDKYEWIEEDKPYRESLLPANIVNELGKPKLLTENEVNFYEEARD